MPARPLLFLCLCLAGCLSDLSIQSNQGGAAAQNITITDSSSSLVLFDGRDTPRQVPAMVDLNRLNLFGRHMGTHFSGAGAASADAQAATGVTGAASIAGPYADLPTAFVQGPGSEVGMYFDTAHLHAMGLFPFTQDYCKSVGLGGPQFTLAQEFNSSSVKPWASATGELTLSAELAVPTSLLTARSGQQLVDVSSLSNGEDVPIFQSSLFFYLRHGGQQIAVLFNVYDPRGSYGTGVGNDTQVFFFTTSIDGADVQHYTLESGSHHKGPFGYGRVSVRIGREQMRKILEVLKESTELSTDPSVYELSNAGVLNEMNFLFEPIPDGLFGAAADPYRCVPHFDPATRARVGLAMRNFKVDVENPPAPVTIGANDGVGSDDVVRGWACQVGQVAPLHVQLTAGAVPLALVLANAEGEDAIADRCGAGGKLHRYAYPVTPGQLAALGGSIVKAVAVEGGLELPTATGINYTLRTPSGGAGGGGGGGGGAGGGSGGGTPAPIELFGSLEGVFTDSDNHVTVSGWACVKGSSQVVTVELSAGGTRLGLVTANEPSEPGVGLACDGASGPHRFSLELSAQQVVALAGQTVGGWAADSTGTHALQLAPAGAWPTALPAYQGGFDGVQADGRVMGWACAIGRDVPVRVTLRTGADELGFTVASLPGEAAIGVLCESGSAHRFSFEPSTNQRSALRGATVTATVETVGGAVYELAKYPGVIYTVQ